MTSDFERLRLDIAALEMQIANEIETLEGEYPVRVTCIVMRRVPQLSGQEALHIKASVELESQSSSTTPTIPGVLP